MSKIIGVTGGKGGTGKSTLAVSLSYELAKKHSVLLVDTDVDCPNCHILLNKELDSVDKVQRRIPYAGKACNKCGLCAKVCKNNAIIGPVGKEPKIYAEQCNGCGACYYACRQNAIKWRQTTTGHIYFSSGNISLLSGELMENEKYSEFVVEKLKQHIKEDYEYVVVDTAAGTHCNVFSALEICDNVLIVTEATPLGIHDLGLIKELVEKLNKKYKIVLNKYDGQDINDNVLIRIPYNRETARKYAEGKIEISQAIKELAEIIK
ncbi:MAG: AAA family ATPase [Candidatus Nanoarchaeia archaeon]